jgi:cell division protein FtsW
MQGPRLVMLLSAFALLLFGFVMVYSTTSIAAVSASYDEYQESLRAAREGAVVSPGAGDQGAGDQGAGAQGAAEGAGAQGAAEGAGSGAAGAASDATAAEAASDGGAAEAASDAVSARASASGAQGATGAVPAANTERDLLKQIIAAAVGAVGCLLAWKVFPSLYQRIRVRRGQAVPFPYQLWLGKAVWVVWALAMLMLAANHFLGVGQDEAGIGARRWIVLGPVLIQSSEIAKIAFLLVAAKILYSYRQGDLQLRGLVVQAVVFVIIPLLFMCTDQKDLGTTLVCAAGILMVMWLGEVPLPTMLLSCLAGIACAAIYAVRSSYGSNRFLFLDPWNDGEGGLGKGYQLIHSYWAFAQGGLGGVGLGNSHEKYQYLYSSESDFVFSIIGEELGFFWALLVIVLFLLFLYAGLRIARHAPDSYGTILAGGFTGMLVAQAFLNIGCAIGVLPTTGKPLPFVSSGGSSVVSSLLMLGIILSVSQAFPESDIHEKKRDDLLLVRAVPEAALAEPSGRMGKILGQEGAGALGCRGHATGGRAHVLGGTGRRGSPLIRLGQAGDATAVPETGKVKRQGKAAVPGAGLQAQILVFEGQAFADAAKGQPRKKR